VLAADRVSLQVLCGKTDPEAENLWHLISHL